MKQENCSATHMKYCSCMEGLAMFTKSHLPQIAVKTK